VIPFASLRYALGLENSRHLFIQSEVKPKSIVNRSHTFSRASRQQHACTSNFDWLIVFLCPLLLARVITLILVLRHSMENRSIMFVLQSMFIPDIGSLTYCLNVLCIKAEFGLFYQVLPNTSLLRSRFLGCHATGRALRDIPKKKNGRGGD